MAYSFIKNKKGGVSVLLDSAADISLVPVDQFFPGTFAFTADGSARYRLSTSRTWVEVAGGVTPGGGWPEDLPLPSEGGYGYTDEDETVHKIDSKYLPEVGGTMVVNFTIGEPSEHDPMAYSLESDKTIAEVVTAVLSNHDVKGILSTPSGVSVVNLTDAGEVHGIQVASFSKVGFGGSDVSGYFVYGEHVGDTDLWSINIKTLSTDNQS